MVESHIALVASDGLDSLPRRCNVFILPKKVMKDIDEVLRRFLWSRTDLKKYGSKVVWEEVCCPKKEGGLGIKCIVMWNKACMLRHMWDLARKKDSMWVQWCHTYMLKGRSLWVGEVHGDVSWTWRKLMKLKDIAWSFIKYKIGNGNDTWLWVDNWHPHGPLLRRYGPRILYDANSNITARVCDIIRDGNWYMPRALSRDLIAIRDELPLYNPVGGDVDRVDWVLNASKKFSCKSAWENLRRHQAVVPWACILWHKDHIPRASMIAWLACKNRLSTKDRLVRWGMAIDANCVLCGEGDESRDHLFFVCNFSRKVWDEALCKCNHNYRCTNWEDELSEVVNRFKGDSLMARVGRLVFAVVIYCIWQERNQRIFGGTWKLHTQLNKEIEQYVCAKAWNWQVRRSYDNWYICKQWGIAERILI